MPNIGMGELIVIMAIALIVFGPKKLPEVGKGIGKALREFNKAKSDFMESINAEADDERPRPASTYSVSDGMSYEDAHPALESGAGPSVRTLEYPEPLAAESADALPYGSDFHAVEGESQPSFRTAPPEPVPASMAAHHSALTGEGKA